MHVSKPLLVIGTRPEAIKMWPVVKECTASPEISPVICFTGQHRELLNQAAEYFELTPDINLDAMRKNQSLAELASRCISGIDKAIAEKHCDSVIAQGDTTTTMSASLASFYRQVPFVHIEAGLRSGLVGGFDLLHFGAGVTAIILLPPHVAIAADLHPAPL